MKFLSDKATALHKEYVENLTLRCTALEKSAPEIIGMPLCEMRKRRFLNKGDIIKLRSEIVCHEIFFSSFGKRYQSSEAVRRKYGSESSFLYELYKSGIEGQGAFLAIFIQRGEVNFKVIECEDVILRCKPILLLDLCEHAYFLDYGFSKGEYLKNSLSCLNLGKLDENSQ